MSLGQFLFIFRTLTKGSSVTGPILAHFSYSDIVLLCHWPPIMLTMPYHTLPYGMRREFLYAYLPFLLTIWEFPLCILTTLTYHMGSPGL